MTDWSLSTPALRNYDSLSPRWSAPGSKWHKNSLLLTHHWFSSPPSLLPPACLPSAPKSRDWWLTGSEWAIAPSCSAHRCQSEVIDPLEARSSSLFSPLSESCFTFSLPLYWFIMLMTRYSAACNSCLLVVFFSVGSDGWTRVESCSLRDPSHHQTSSLMIFLRSHYHPNINQCVTCHFESKILPFWTIFPAASREIVTPTPHHPDQLSSPSCDPRSSWYPCSIRSVWVVLVSPLECCLVIMSLFPIAANFQNVGWMFPRSWRDQFAMSAIECQHVSSWKTNVLIECRFGRNVTPRHVLSFTIAILLCKSF